MKLRAKSYIKNKLPYGSLFFYPAEYTKNKYSKGVIIVSEKIGILVIHGIGAVEESFKKDFNTLKNSINNLIPDNLKSRCFWNYLFWLGEINKKEEEYKKNIKKYRLNNCFGLRDFILDTVADEVVYRGNREESGTIYDNVQKNIYGIIQKIYSEVG